ncbi:uncharacterized protein LOC111875476 isoform X2 [Cryptotermes secundus]|uniref:uncharacterized protein LOC111875476 isoform X2 n=1 Tax=Cryptotermes secundus TaxID=105785 RepID=UPI001454CC60|nr:uncharacterized protein LOC111875476 isoform X2 [Cryptotermes secundus]
MGIPTGSAWLILVTTLSSAATSTAASCKYSPESRLMDCRKVSLMFLQVGKYPLNDTSVQVLSLWNTGLSELKENVFEEDGWALSAGSSSSRSKVELSGNMEIDWPSPCCVEGHQSKRVIPILCFKDYISRYVDTRSTDCADSSSATCNSAYLKFSFLCNYFVLTLHCAECTLVYVEYLVRCKPKFCDIVFQQIK